MPKPHQSAHYYYKAVETYPCKDRPPSIRIEAMSNQPEAATKAQSYLHASETNQFIRLIIPQTHSVNRTNHSLCYDNKAQPPLLIE